MHEIDSPWNNVSLVAEYPYQYGGAQRLLATLAKKLKKDVYLTENGATETKIWDQNTVTKQPPNDIVLSIVVDGRTFQEFPSKRNIKFCHSKSSLERHAQKEAAKNIAWITHRERPYRYWKRQGFNITLIPDGYIPYDKTELEITPHKNNQAIFISRISKEKCPKSACEAARAADIPLVVAGSWDSVNLAESLRKEYPSTRFPEPQQGRHVSLSQRNKYLEESKILLHGSTGGMRDYLEYSILDGMRFGCVPVCITPDKEQYSIINSEDLGKVVYNETALPEAMEHVLENYDAYQERVRKFMLNFFSAQSDLMQRWENTLSKLLTRL